MKLVNVSLPVFFLIQFLHQYFCYTGGGLEATPFECPADRTEVFQQIPVENSKQSIGGTAIPQKQANILKLPLHCAIVVGFSLLQAICFGKLSM